MRLLALDSGGSRSSVALWQDGAVLAQAGTGGGHHSEQLLRLVERCLAEAGVSLRQLDAIACGRGPGAFTGVRLALSVAQGLAYAVQRGVILVSNLQAAAERAGREPGVPERLVVCHDARMQEVYWACYLRGPRGLEEVRAEAVASPGTLRLPEAWTRAGPVWGVGTGFAAYAAPLAGLRAGLARCLEVEGEAEDVVRLAALGGLERAVAPELAVPRYLRDDVVAPPPGVRGAG
jgi:tRNA threonylcarbamoyladenosine biosynthesis protein TsaB